MTFEVPGPVQKLKFWGLLALMRGLALLPWRVLYVLGGALGYAFWRSDSRERQIARANIDYCLPDWPAPRRAGLERATLLHFGRIALEIAKVWFGSRAALERAIVSIEGEELLAAAGAEGRGVLLLVPHHGNWEVLGVYMARRYPFTAMYLPAKDAAVDGIIRMARTRSGGAVAAANNSGVRAVLKALKQGGVVGMLPDQVPKQAGAEFAPFFGQPALTMTLPANLLQKTGACAVFGCAFRADDGRGFRIVFRAAEPDIYSDDLAASLAALNRSVEALILERPEQFQWEYKRFKTQPDGAPRMYRDLRD